MTTMSSFGSVTYWFQQLQAGDGLAAQRLWERYFRQLLTLARAKLRTPLTAGDEEDVVLSAFANFCHGAQSGRFPQMRDRHDLWQLLLVITARKALAQRNNECRLKRGGGKVQQASALTADDSAVQAPALTQMIGREPTPEFAAQVAEECQRLLDSLGDVQLRSVAVWKMEGYTNDEIAGKLGRTPRSVERKLQLIRRILAPNQDACIAENAP
jgi:DNA-directed RNA polymerase specialized sigma24 family protein